MKRSASVRAATCEAGSSSSRRISSPSGAPPGSRNLRCGTPARASASARRSSCVLFPAPSTPSKTISRPPAIGSPQRDDGARRALPDPIEDPLVHLHHHLVEVLVRDHHPLVRRVGLHLAEQAVQLLLHLRRRVPTLLDHPLRIRPELLHLLQQRHCGLVLIERIVRALHGLVLGALADQSPQFHRPLIQHVPVFSGKPALLSHPSPASSHTPHISALRATRNRSLPVKSSRISTSAYPPAVAPHSRASAARRVSISSTNTPPGSSTDRASRTSARIAAIPFSSLNRAPGGSHSRTLAGRSSASEGEI